MHPIAPLPLPVKKALRKLGDSLRKARLRRRITMQLMAERVSISRSTLAKAEKGDPSVSLGIYAVILFVLGLTSNLEKLVDVGQDPLGQMLEEENLPKRVRHPRTKRESEG